jgi:hypothetical protein
MPLIINVQGGTGAGKRTPRPQNRKDWVCPDCGARCKYYWLKCPVKGCGHRRPEEA